MSANRPNLRLPKMPTGFRAPFRTIGPGSVSSLLKIALDVAYVLLMIFSIVMNYFFGRERGRGRVTHWATGIFVHPI